MATPSKALGTWFLLVGACAVACYTAPEDGASSSGSSGGVAASGCTSTIASIQEKLFVPKCATAGCHTGTKPAAGLDLAAAGVDARLVGVTASCPAKVLVAQGSPSTSVLVDKLTNATPACGGDRMPVGGALEAGDLACITDWIAGLSPGSVPDGGGADSGSSITCGAGETACGGACVDTKTSPANCGACGTTCSGATKFCVAGACSATCPLTDCSGACVDTKTDASNCGACGKACTGGQVCTNSACACPGTATTLATLQSTIFQPTCTGAGCHSKVGPKTAAEGLDLSTAALSYANLVGKASTCAGKTRVVPNDITSSYLINKLTGAGMSCAGSKMPKGASLSAAEIDSVRNWICNGANP